MHGEYNGYENPNIDMDNMDYFVYDDAVKTLAAIADDVYRSNSNKEDFKFEAEEHPNPIYRDVFSVLDLNFLPDYCFKEKRAYNAVRSALKYLSEILQKPYVVGPQEFSLHESDAYFHFETINAFRELLLMFAEFSNKHNTIHDREKLRLVRDSEECE